MICYDDVYLFICDLSFNSSLVSVNAASVLLSVALFNSCQVCTSCLSFACSTGNRIINQKQDFVRSFVCVWVCVSVCISRKLMAVLLQVGKQRQWIDCCYIGKALLFDCNQPSYSSGYLICNSCCQSLMVFEVNLVKRFKRYYSSCLPYLSHR